ncbi:MAG TPA: S-layer protein [Candidatus Thermoplasmatota archaeon]|nr:S-layer protein [Candidatus Thermoplasmatota archaeon]
MPYLVDDRDGETLSLPVRVVDPKRLRTALSPQAWAILRALVEGPATLAEVARRCRVGSQRAHYHLRQMARSGLVSASRRAGERGARDVTVYDVEDGGFAVALREMAPAPKIAGAKPGERRYLAPFVVDGSLHATIVVGSPEPHGPYKARSKDGAHAIQLGLFLGTYLTFPPEGSVKLDTEIREDDLKRNLILVGGPAVNAVTARMNDGLPVRFEHHEAAGVPYGAVVSDASRRTYLEDEIGVIVRAPNPLSREHEILLLAGRRYTGTRAAVLAFTTRFDEVARGNAFRPGTDARIVEGVDADADGVVDAIEFRE